MTMSIERRLRELEDRMSIIDLEARYARSFDERDGAGWSALFTEDGIYQSRPLGDAPPATFVQGRAALHDFCRDAPFTGIHMLHLPQVSFDGDRAVARIHLSFHGSWPHEHGSLRLDMQGYYDVAYLRVGAAWRISHRVTTAYSREQRTVPGYPTDSGLPPS